MNIVNNNAIFTVCNVAYLNKAMVLAESLHEHSNVKLEIFVFDKKRRVEFDSQHCNLHWVEELEIPHFESLSFKYTVVFNCDYYFNITLAFVMYDIASVFYNYNLICIYSHRNININFYCF